MEIKKHLSHIKTLYLRDEISKNTLKLLKKHNLNGVGVSSKFIQTEPISKIIDSTYEYHIWDDGNITPKIVKYFIDIGVNSLTLDDIL